MLAAALALFAAAAPVSFGEVAAQQVPPPDRREAYGEAPQQFGELRLPPGPGPHPVVILLHGGCWQAAFGYEYMRGAAAALAAAGIATWTPEYRKVGEPGGGWPGTLQDAARAADHLRVLARHADLDLTRVAAVGHSAGGHLALWLAARPRLTAPFATADPLPLRGVVGLAALSDLSRAQAEGVCGLSVEQLLGGAPGFVPDRYALASPLSRLPLRVPLRLVHGADDPIVPAAHSRDFAGRARQRGDAAEAVIVDGARHFDLVYPRAAAWAAVVAAVKALLAPPAAARASAESFSLEVGGGQVEAQIEPGVTVPTEALRTWIGGAARAIAGYYGRLPFPRVRIAVPASGRGRIGFGQMLPMQEPPTVRVPLGPQATAEDLERDWVLPHEMVHFGFPDVEGGEEWIEEGLATYVEPVARARAGLTSEGDLWKELVGGLPRGLSARGMDEAVGYQRIYWGGALFWLLADVEIRSRSDNRKGLEDVLRAVLARGGNGQETWPFAKIAAIAQEATGLDTVGRLQAQMAQGPAPVSLDTLWARLGVKGDGRGVTFDDAAPLAAVRRAIAGQP